MNDSHGWTLVEVLVVTLLVALASTAVAPDLRRIAVGARAAAGAREIVLACRALRWKSVTTGRGHGMLFERDERGWYWFDVVDGNGNGLRTLEVASGADLTLSGPHRLEHRVPGVRFGLPALDSIPQIPPRRGTLEDRGDPIRIGGTDLLSFSPAGTSSSGTLYLTDGRRELYAVVLFGKTVRLRVWRFDATSRRWTL